MHRARSRIIPRKNTRSSTLGAAGVCLFTFLAAPLPAAHADPHFITKSSANSVSETIDALEKALTAKGIKIMARVDHAAGAKAAGLDLPATQLLIFGNPKLGTPLMQSNRAIGLDLPMKALAWKDVDGKVYLSYTEPDELKDRYDIDDRNDVFAKMTKALDGLTNAATAKAAE